MRCWKRLSKLPLTNCLAYLLIISGITSLIGIAVFNYGFFAIVKFTFPIVMSLVSLYQTFQIWIDVPLPMRVSIVLMNASSISPIPQPFGLGIGHVTLDLHMYPWYDGTKSVYPLVWIEESAEVDVLQRYLLGFTDGPLNYAKYICWAVGLAALVPTLVGAILLLKQFKKESKIGADANVNIKQIETADESS